MSSAYGKYYLEVATAEVLSTEGLVNHITHHNCAVGTEAIAAVIKKLGECIPELVAQGQPVKIDGLGIFYPTAENKKNGLLKSQLLDSKVNPLDALSGVHLRFRPQSDDLNDLTSKSFLKMQVQPVINLVCRANRQDQEEVALAEVYPVGVPQRRWLPLRQQLVKWFRYRRRQCPRSQCRRVKQLECYVQKLS